MFHEWNMFQDLILEKLEADIIKGNRLSSDRLDLYNISNMQLYAPLLKIKGMQSLWKYKEFVW